MWDRACPGSAARAAHDLKGAGETQAMHLEAMMRFHDRLLGPRWRSHHGHQALVDGVVAPLRPCAARAALREQALLPRLFRASYVCGIAWTALFFRHGTVSRPPGAWLKVSGALETVRRPRGASRASPVPHLFRASYVCAIAWTALLIWLGIGSGPPCACLGFFGALEIVRRPRGASRASPVPRLFRASYVCAIAWTALLFGLGLGQGGQVHGWMLLAPSIPCAARAALRECLSDYLRHPTVRHPPDTPRRMRL